MTVLVMKVGSIMRDSDALFQQLELLKINRGHSQYHGRVCGKG